MNSAAIDLKTVKQLKACYEKHMTDNICHIIHTNLYCFMWKSMKK